LLPFFFIVKNYMVVVKIIPSRPPRVQDEAPPPLCLPMSCRRAVGNCTLRLACAGLCD
jgi:hypothetical protein